MIFVVADAHLEAGDSLDGEFREMLSHLSRTSHDVLFLGDIMDLWVGKERYEQGCHREFLQWCRSELPHRRIYFVEGNHEFFVAGNHAEDFTEAVAGTLMLGRALFQHGHAIQGNPFSFNRLFIPLCKSWFGNLVLTCMPFGCAFANLVKRMLGGRHGEPVFPRTEVRNWAGRLVASDHTLATLVVGHFHKAGTLDVGSATCHALPAWKSTGEAALFNPDDNTLTCDNWRRLIG